jgi:transcriptional regulator with XRE-family HTH domain
MKSFDDLRKELIQHDPEEYFLLEIVGKLMAARDRKKLSQRDLSKMTGVAQKTISRIENGKDVPELSTLLKLARALDLEIKIVDKNVKDEHSATIMV